MKTTMNRTSVTTTQPGAANHVSRPSERCCPYANQVRYHKFNSLKDQKIFSLFNGGHVEKKRMTSDEIDERAGTPMMYYL